MRAIRGEWSGDDRRMRGESQAGQNSIAEIVTERVKRRHFQHDGACVRMRSLCALVRMRVDSASLRLEVLAARRSAPFRWKNHFHEMKWDVGMSSYEIEKEQEDAYTKTESHS